MDPSAYKELHESFMKNHNGTTAEEVFFTTIPTFFCSLITINLILIAQPMSTIMAFFIEFVLVILMSILSFTVLNDRIWELAFTLIFLVLTIVMKQLHGKTHLAPFIRIPSQRPCHISVIRSVTSIMTAVCILGVDFKIFPRKLAKTETFGFGLMDLGVGLFVYCNGIQAPELYKIDTKTRLTLAKVKTVLVSSAPLYILGFLRFFITNEIDYQQHVSEYGVNWNFFFTLAFTRIIATLIISVLPSLEYTKFAAVVILTLHELLLQSGISNYILDPTKSVGRDNLITANREGIFSIPGYVALYIGSVYIGYVIKKKPELPNQNENEPQTENERNRQPWSDHFTVRQMLGKALHVFLIAAVLWKVVYTVKNMFGVSRRMANMGYVLWLLAFCATQSSISMLYEVFIYFRKFELDKSSDADDDEDKETKTHNRNSENYLSPIVDGIAYNSLGFFLVANLLTGLTNLIFQTFLIDTAGSLLILCTYMFILCGMTTFLYVKKIKLKIW